MQTPAEFVRGLSQSVNIVKMFIMLVWEALEAPGGLEKVREVGQQGVGGGGIISLTFLTKATSYRQTLQICF